MSVFQLGDKALKISMKLFANNRSNLLERIRKAPNLPPSSIIILQGGKSETRHCTDHEEIFRQESFFHWCFGVTEPDFFGAIEVDSGNSILFAPLLPPEYAVWMGKIQPCSYFKTKYEVDEVHHSTEISSVLKQKSPSRLLTLHGLNSDSGNFSKEASFDGIETFAVDNTILHRHITEARVFKSPEELEVMRYANKISSDAHKEIMKNVKPGMFEFELESLFKHYCYQTGGMRHMSYTCICAAGHNSATLHYGHAGAPNDKRINDNELCLFDMGGEYYCYGSDITCTFPANGKFNPEQKFVYETTLKANRAVLDACQPGVEWHDMHLKADRVILEEFVKAGLLVGDIDEMLQHRISAIFFPHGLGHLLGIDTHDVGGFPEGRTKLQEPGLKSLRMVRPLEPGMILTIEPGVYFIDYLLEQAYADPVKSKYLVKEQIDKYLSVGGVRIEDNVYINEYGAELLTDVPRTVDEIEKFMSEHNVHLKKN